MGRQEKIRLGDVLVLQKVISQEQLRVTLDLQKKSGRKLGRILIEQGFATEEQISKALARQFGITYVNLKFFNAVPELVRRLPELMARRHRAIVLEERGDKYLVGMADPTDLFAYDELARVLKRDLDIAVI